MRVRIPLGETTGIEEATYSEFQTHILTRFSDVWKFIPRLPQNEGRNSEKKDKTLKKPKDKILEHHRYAEKLRDADKIYAKKKLQRERERESIWKQPSTYLIFGSGLIIGIIFPLLLLMKGKKIKKKNNLVYCISVINYINPKRGC